MKSQPPRPAPRQTNWLVWVLLAAILLGAFVIRWRLRACPLERDEGEYAYIGRLILEGVAPYGVAGNHKFPGAYLAYAAIMAVFGQTIPGIHLGMLVVNLANTLLIFFLGRRLSGTPVGLAAAAAWVVMSISPGVYGNAGHITHLVVLAVLTGAVLLWRWEEKGHVWDLIGAGLCLGASVVVRQTSAVFVLLGVVFVWRAASAPRAKQVAIVLLSSAVPLVAMGAWLWFAGVFPQFWRWTFTEAAAYGSQVSFGAGLHNFLETTPLVIGWNCLIWIGAAAGLVLAFRERSQASWFVIGLLIAGGAALSAGLYFRGHYYIQVLPAIALLFAMALQKASNLGGGLRYIPAIGTTLACVLPLVAQRSYFLETQPIAMSRYVYKANPFPETIEVARYLRENSDPTDLIGVLGSEPQIFFYAQRRSATSLIYTYPLMEHHRYAHGMQETMAHELEETNPKFIVFVNAPTSWLSNPDSDQFILEWADRFLSRYYQLEGMADILAEGSQYVWGPAAKSYRPRSPYTVDVYRRID
ncbi:MAG: ArnT family glycosyltransferase [Chthoniobacterales bacterium]